MPLTKKGQKILKKFKVQYGARGEEVFYAHMRKHPELTKDWERR